MFTWPAAKASLLDNKFHSNRIGGLDKGRWSELSLKMADSGDVSDHPYQAQFQALFDALDRGKEMPLTALADGMRTHRAVLAADLSALEKRTVASLKSAADASRYPFRSFGGRKRDSKSANRFFAASSLANLAPKRAMALALSTGPYCSRARRCRPERSRRESGGPPRRRPRCFPGSA